MPTFKITKFDVPFTTVLEPKKKVILRIEDLKRSEDSHYFLIAEIDGVRQEWLIYDFYYNNYDIYIKEIQCYANGVPATKYSLELGADTEYYEDAELFDDDDEYDDDDNRTEDYGVLISVTSFRTEAATVKFWVSPARTFPADAYECSV